MDILSESLGLTGLDEKTLHQIDVDLTEYLSDSNSNNNQRGSKNSFYGRHHSTETKKILADKAKNNKRRLGKIHSDETKCKIRLKMLGRPSARKGVDPWNKGVSHSIETKLKISKSRMGIEVSDETRMKLSISAKNKIKQQCPHCKNFFDPVNYKRWHGDKCKHA